MNPVFTPIPSAPHDYQPILDFWFGEATQPFWFAKSEAFDAQIRTQFGAVWQQAKAGECAH